MPHFEATRRRGEVPDALQIIFSVAYDVISAIFVFLKKIEENEEITIAVSSKL